MRCDVGCRYISDQVLQWLWYRLAAAAPHQFLAWELPYAMGAALEKQKQKPRRLPMNAPEAPPPASAPFHHSLSPLQDNHYSDFFWHR